jgi:hypothetical protein
MTMTRIRVLLVSVVAVAAVSAIASASAFAVEKECSTVTSGEAEKLGDVAICKGTPLKEAEGEFPFTSKKKPMTTSKFTVAATGLTVECTAAKNTGTIVATNSALKVSKLIITFENCTAPNPAHCAVAGGKIVTSEVEGVFKEEKTEKIKFTAPSGTFATFTIESSGGTCLAAVLNGKVKGSQECKLTTAETLAVVQELKCEETESALTFAGNPAKFELTEEFELEAKTAFGFYPS